MYHYHSLHIYNMLTIVPYVCYLNWAGECVSKWIQPNTGMPYKRNGTIPYNLQHWTTLCIRPATRKNVSQYVYVAMRSNLIIKIILFLLLHRQQVLINGIVCLFGTHFLSRRNPNMISDSISTIWCGWVFTWLPSLYATRSP